MKMNRVISYIDGFNLYFGLRDKGWRRFYWLNVQLLVQNLLKFNQELIMTKYFTARVIGATDKEKRQSTFIEALETLSNLEIFYGKYQLNPRECPPCGFKDQVPNEKMTDVNIAVEIFSDAAKDKFDTALLLSADSDLAPLVRAVKNTFTHKRIVVAFPPKRESVELRNIAHACLRIGRANFARSLFPDKVKKPDGFILQRPPSWE
jgi:uncharacterized LabA/DUF88 family protein